MSDRNQQRQSLYFPEDMLEEIKAEAVRLDRSISWVVQRTWMIARKEVRKLPSDAAPGSDREEP